jgi:4-hydroxybenzoate polyprenyltransferase
MQLVTTFIDKIENITTSLKGLLLVFITIVFVRTFFENFTNSNNAGFLNGPNDTFFHYPLWWMGLLLANVALIHLLTKQSLIKVSNIVVFSFWGTLIVPIIDIFTHGFLGHTYNFIAGSYAELWQHFITFTFSNGSFGLGGKIETVLVILGVGIYVYVRAKNHRVLKAMLGGFLAYVILFFFLSIPTHIMSLANLLSSTDPVSLSEMVNLSQQAPDGTTLPVLKNNFDIRTLEYTYLTKKISIVFSFIIILLLGFILAIKKRLWGILRFMRWEHIIHILLFVTAGLYLGSLTNTYTTPHDFYYTLNILAVIISSILACFFVVCDNDESDVVVDQISQPDRPLAAKAISPKEWSYLKYTSLALALVIAWLGNYAMFTCIALFMLLYHSYSKPPLRLKKIPLVSSFVVVISALCMFVAGFFTTNYSHNLGTLPFGFILGIFVIYFLVENIKNMKDIAGDQSQNVYTLPVILKKYAAHGMSILVSLATIFAFSYFNLDNKTIIISIPIIIGILFFLHRKPYSEKPIFILYFVFILLLFIL